MNRSVLAGKTGGFGIGIVVPMLLCICLASCCMHAPAPYRPSRWMGTSTTMESIADIPDQSLLQVIIVYGPAWCHHTALRLVCPDRPVLFWDPGGSYGVSDPRDVRSKDLIRINPPNLETYLRFTWKHSSTEVEVFEWDLSPEQARDLYDVLLRGTDKNDPAGRFTTTTLGLFCSEAVSDFLHRFAAKIMTVPKSFFLPHNLAKVLYTQSPRRVLSFRPKRQTMYVPHRVTSGDSDSSHISK